MMDFPHQESGYLGTPDSLQIGFLRQQLRGALHLGKMGRFCGGKIVALVVISIYLI